MPAIRPDLPSDLIASYNGHQFSTVCKLGGIRCEPIQDRAKRTFVAIKHTITIVDWLQADVNTNLDTEAAALKTTLLQPACQFTLQFSGFGKLNINVPGGGGARDVEYGPWPKSFLFEDVGHNQAAQITWVVEITIPVCENTTFFKGQPMEVDYRCSFSNDRGGYVTRTHSGYIRIPATRVTPTTRKPLPDSVDEYRSLITPNLQGGFRRTRATFDIDDQKTSMTWNIVDEQMESVYAPPPGIVEADEEHELQTRGKNQWQWFGNLRASYELTRGRSFASAFQEFAALVASRINETAKYTKSEVVRGNFVPGAKQSIIPLSRTITQPKIRGKPMARFSVSYSYVCSLNDAFNATAIAIEPPHNKWEPWVTSMFGSKAFDPYGMAQLMLKASDDSIIDLCVDLRPNVGQSNQTPQAAKVPTPQTKPAQPGAKPGGGIFDGGFGNSRPAAGGSDPWGFTPPPKDQSWMSYDLEIVIEVEDNNVELKPLPVKPVQITPQTVGVQDTTGLTLPYNTGALPTSIVQTRGAPSIYVTLRGMALRAIYEISMPQLVSVGGVKPIPMNQRGSNYFITKVVANAGFPINRALWSWTWLLPRWPSGGIATPPNPMLGTATGGGDSGLSGFVTSR